MDERTLVVVDADPTLRRLWQAWLDSHGYRSACFNSAESALRDRAAIEDACALITGFNLPGKSGLGLIRQLRALRPQLPVLMITGSENEALALALAEDPHAVLLGKPVPLAKLEAALARLFSQARMHRHRWTPLPFKSSTHSAGAVK